MNAVLVVLTVLCFVTPARAGTILVVPFHNASKNANLDWIGESVAETLREALGNHGLMVLGRDEVLEAYRRLGLRHDAQLTRATLIKVGQSLDADKVLYGDFESTPAPAGTSGRGSLRIGAQLLDLRHMTQGARFSELGALEDLASAQGHLAWQAIRFIDPESAPTEEAFRAAWRPVRIDALESYIRGLLAASPEQKIRLFSQAARLEPAFADAAFQLGTLAYARKDYRSGTEWLQKIPESDIHFRKASFYLGICRFETGDYAGAQGAFQRIVAQVPLNEVYNNLGVAQIRRNDPAAVETLRKAIEGDPSDPVYHFNEGVALWKTGRLAEAAERFRAVLERTPQDQEATTMLGRCLKNAPPKPAESRERIERLKDNFDESAFLQLKALLKSEKP